MINDHKDPNKCKILTADLEILKVIQRHISKKIKIIDLNNKSIESVSGIDVAYDDEMAIVAVATFDYEDKQYINKRIEFEHVKFPYIPGFLGFREGPLIIGAIKRKRINSDMYMLNSHGIAHPERCGCASYVGVLINKPTIGIASKVLCGSYEREPMGVGDWTPLIYNDKRVGAILKSKRGCKPIVVSPGNMITLEKSIRIVKEFIKDEKFPEPLRIAHQIAIDKRREIRDFF